jgi:hypothetical protein
MEHEEQPLVPTPTPPTGAAVQTERRQVAGVPDYGEVLHLLHALRYLVSGSATPLVDHLIARLLDLMKRDC